MAKKKLSPPPVAVEPSTVAIDSVEVEPGRGLSRGGKIALAAAILVMNFPLIHYFVFRGEAPSQGIGAYQNDFSKPDSVSNDFFSTGALWRVENGALLSPGSKNNPLWLRTRLPDDAVVEFDVKSMSPEGDIKVEIFGNGIDHASGYILIFGGWNNSLSIIARLDEHGTNYAQLDKSTYRANTRTRIEARPFNVEIQKTYHFRIERNAGLLLWSIDGREFMRFDDPMPLRGPGHDRFGFSSWEAQLVFDNLKVSETARGNASR
jgi:hypothetical protein